jgi:subfamily B ATP-binding cassette protein MsbA
LVIQAGEAVAIVGKSGAGKSTLVNLLLRFYEPTSGKILIDEYPITAWKLSSLREKIAVVSQDPILFSNSIRDNIAYGKPNASDAEIIEVAKAANAHDFIVALPNGYNTQIGERGAKLSTGQRQRISIARALLKNPSILILDEATSNVDSHSEALIQDALKRLVIGKTTIVVAHRLSTVINASRIIVLEDGVIVEMGVHEELLQKRGIYAMLYKSQLQT